VAVEPVHRYVLGIYLSENHSILVVKLFPRTMIEKTGSMSSNLMAGGGVSARLSSLEAVISIAPLHKKSVVEGTDQDRLNLFADIHYEKKIHVTSRQPTRFLSAGGAP
jgi:hypothetical protein